MLAHLTVSEFPMFVAGFVAGFLVTRFVRAYR